MNDGKHPFDDIFASIKAGDEAVFSILFRKYYRRLCDYCFQFVKRNDIAEELASDALYSLWRKKEEINITFNLTSYLYKSARNMSLNYLQSKERHSNIVSLSEDKEEFSDSESAHLYSYAYHQPLEADHVDEKLFSDKISRIYAALSFLSPLRQQIMDLYFLKGLKAKEIASRLSIPEKTVRNNIERGTRQLRQMVQSSRNHSDTLLFLMVLQEALHLISFQLN